MNSYNVKETIRYTSQPISINLNNKENNENKYNLSIKQGCFDPTKNSPPNFFIQNLEGRYKNYYQNEYSIKDY